MRKSVDMMIKLTSKLCAAITRGTISSNTASVSLKMGPSITFFLYFLRYLTSFSIFHRPIIMTSEQNPMSLRIFNYYQPRTFLISSGSEAAKLSPTNRLISSTLVVMSITSAHMFSQALNTLAAKPA